LPNQGFSKIQFSPIMENATTCAVHVANLSVIARGKGGRSKLLLSGIHFDLEAGGLIGVIGASGCGKSTLIRALAGQIQPATGHILFAGHSIADIQEQYPLAVGYLPQFGAFHNDLTVEENLRTAVALRLPASVSKGVRENWVLHIIELAGLQALLAQPYSTLSGGQMRRMALAEELIGDPAFLLLDELTSGLDAFSDREMMSWLRDLAHVHGKTIILVTHATYHLDYCDRILFLHQARQVQYGSLQKLLASHHVSSIADLFQIYQSQEIEFPLDEPQPESDVAVQSLKTAKPPSGFAQLPTLLARHLRLFWRDRTQLYLHLALIITFPALIAVFAVKGLPQVRQLTLSLQSNIVQTLADQLLYLKEAFHSASLVSGLAMFQVILLTLIGANNGAREIAKEKGVLAKELHAGLSPIAYVSTKFLHLVFLSVIQAFWMAYFVKFMCGFPGSLADQFGILFATTLSMSTICLAISAGSPSPERASLLAIYLVGFQLPLSGAALSLPDWLSSICRPFIAAYWGWSGYLKTLEYTRHYDIVKQSTNTVIAGYGTCLAVLGIHVLLGLFLSWWFVLRSKTL
jgi:ABC transport system ATP-binding/permease protein